MPIYEYVCPTCGTFEQMQKVSEPALTHCPRGHAGVERKISAAGFILKGSGWYVTDYARKGTNGKPATEKPATEKSKAEGSTADGKGADKPAAEAKAVAETKPATAGSDAGK
jgi:putative FmdB family regulatory protein